MKRKLAWLAGSALLLAETAFAQTVHPLPSGVTGEVRVLATQPDGKIVVGGNFSAVNDVPRANIARLNPDGSTDASWNPAADGAVRAVAVHDNVVYVGGEFKTIGGQVRGIVAALDMASGQATSWNPMASDYAYGTYVQTIALSSDASIIYFAGKFTFVGPNVRRGIAAASRTTGAPTSWDPKFSRAGSVDEPRIHAMTVLPQQPAGADDIVYVSGDWTTINAATNTSTLVALRSSDASALEWAGIYNGPGGNGGFVEAAIAANGSVYLGGSFRDMFATPGISYVRSHIAALEPYHSYVPMLDWAPAIDGTVKALAVSDDLIYVGGSFSTIGGENHHRLAAIPLSPSDAVPLQWDPLVNGNIDAVAIAGESVVVAGSFTQMRGISRSGLAAVSVWRDEIFRNGFEANVP